MNAQNEQHFTEADMADQAASAFERGRASVLAEQPAAAQGAVAYRLEVQTDEVEPFTQYVTDRVFIATLRNSGCKVRVTPLYAAPVAAAPGIDLAREIQHAIADAGLAPLHPTEYKELRDVIRRALDASPKVGSEGDDAALLDWMDANGFTAYRQIDPIDGLSRHCVVVAEAVAPRHGNVHDTIRGAIRAAMKAQDGDAEVQP